MKKDLVRHQPASSTALQHREQSLTDMWLQGRSASTLVAYKQDLQHFASYIGIEVPAAAAAHLVGLAPGEANGLVLAYRNAQLDAGLSPATVNRRLAALRSLVELAATLGRIAWTLRVSNVKGRSYRDTRGPTLDVLRQVLEGLKGSRNEARDRAVLLLMFDAALRRGEVAELRLRDVDMPGRRLSVLGKGRREREWFSLPSAVVEALRAWLALPSAPQAAGDLLFGLQYRSLYRVVQAAGRRAKQVVRPHGLRHGGITTALDVTNGDVRRVMKLSRHADVRTLMIYDDARRDDFGEVSEMITRAREDGTK